MSMVDPWACMDCHSDTCKHVIGGALDGGPHESMTPAVCLKHAHLYNQTHVRLVSQQECIECNATEKKCQG